MDDAQDLPEPTDPPAPVLPDPSAPTPAGDTEDNSEARSDDEGRLTLEQALAEAFESGDE